MTYPISINEVQQHLRLGTVDADEQAEIQVMIASATEMAENYCNRSFTSSTALVHFDRFPSSEETPLVVHADVTGSLVVEYYDTSNVQQTYSTTRLINNAGRTKVYPAFGEVWPYDCNNLPSNIVATFTQGDTANVPSSVKSAVLLMVADLYENRENDVVGAVVSKLTSMTSNRLLHPYKTRVS